MKMTDEEIRVKLTETVSFFNQLLVEIPERIKEKYPFDNNTPFNEIEKINSIKDEWRGKVAWAKSMVEDCLWFYPSELPETEIKSS